MSNSSAGIVTHKSVHSIDETVRRLEEVLRSRGSSLFATIDHSGEVERVGLQMPNTKLVIFGHPKAGTPIMLASPHAAIHLPLKILISEDRGAAFGGFITVQATFRLDTDSRRHCRRTLPV